MAVVPPLRDGSGVQAATYLCGTRRGDRSRVVEKVATAVLPAEPAILKKPECFSALVRNEILVAQFVDGPGECFGPVPHEAAITHVVAAELFEVIGEWVSILKEPLVN